MHLTPLAALVSCMAAVEAHVALWDKGMFGYNYPNQASDKEQDYNNNAPVTPLRQMDGLTVDQWFGHGYKSFPPVSGDFMSLPSGGTYNGEIQCNRAQTKMGNPASTEAKPQYACDGEGALHTTNRFGQSVSVKAFGGTSLGIAYTSDINSLRPNDMTIISVNYASPWTRQVAYKIPAGMPPCPSGGCICSWNWIHRAGNGEGYGEEIYNLLYRCKITGSTNANNVVQRGAVPVDCTGNSAKCVKGPKTGLYLYQRDGNNLPSLDVPPTYTADWGFSDGAQNDIFTKSSNPAGDQGLINPYATGTGTVSYSDPPPTATAIPSGWKSVGCTVDSNTRYLTTQAYSLDTNTISMCVAKCNSLGFSAAGLQGGRECWCGNPTKSPTMAPESECDSRCPGDIFAFCGGAWRSSLYTKQAAAASSSKAATTTTTSKAAATSTAVVKTTSSTSTSTSTKASTSAAASPSSSIPAGWRSLGCHGEKSGSRMFSADRTESGSMKAAKCIAYCSAKGYKYVGLQYMTQCYCGDTFTENPVSGCDSKCGGDKSQICGGVYKNTVYTSVAATKRSFDDDEEVDGEEGQGGVVQKILDWVPFVPDTASSLLKRSADEASGAIEKIMDWVPWPARHQGDNDGIDELDVVDHSILERSFDPTSDAGDVEPVEDWEPWPMRMAAEKAHARGQGGKGTDTDADAESARLRRRHFARPRGRDLDRRF